jgi:hypothetical protein
MNFGTKSFISEPIGNFQGDDDITVTPASSLFSKLFNERKLSAVNPMKHMSSVDSRDAKVQHFMAKVMHGGEQNHKAQLDLSAELTYRMRLDHSFENYTPVNLLMSSAEPVLPTRFDCLRTMVQTFKDNCGKLEDYSLKFVKHLVADCEAASDTYSMKTLQQKLILACTI